MNACMHIYLKVFHIYQANMKNYNNNNVIDFKQFKSSV